MRKLQLLLLLLFLASPAWAQIAYDNSGSTSTTNGASTITLSFTVGGSLSNSILVAKAHNRTSELPTGATYNSVAMTEVTGARSDDTGNGETTTTWYLINPASGTHNLVVTYAGGPDYKVLGAISLQGVDQSNPIDAATHLEGTGTAVSTSITTVNDNAWIIDGLAVRATTPTATMTAHTGRTERYNTAAGTALVGAASTYGPISPAGATTVDWTAGTSGISWAFSIISLKPSGGGGGSNVIKHKVSQ
jgi:hypothetical protein